MSLPTQALPTIGLPNSTEDSKIVNCLTELQTILTGNIDAANRGAAVQASHDFGGGNYGPGNLLPLTITGSGRPVLVALLVSGTAAPSASIGIKLNGALVTPADWTQCVSGGATQDFRQNPVWIEPAPVAGAQSWVLSITPVQLTATYLRWAVCEL